MPAQGQGSTANIIAAIASFFIPGLGQLVQGRLLAAAVQFVLAAVLWVIWLGWIVHIWSIVDAARYTPPQSNAGPGSAL
jgi:TM2 domain-containing membrane protein YozV